MSFDMGMVVSLPANELQNISITDSIFDMEVCPKANFSPQLRCALQLVEECVKANAPKLIVARPEMFTSGITLKWLNENLHGVKDHVCFSDGSAIRLIAGFRNHVFFFGLGSAKHVDALARLERRVPEIFTQVYSQFNTAIKFRWKENDVSPQTYVALPSAESIEKDEGFRRLVINRYSIQDSVARMADSLLPEVDFSRFSSLTYIRVTEHGFYDERIAKRILSLIARGIVDRSQGLILVLPNSNTGDSTLASRLLILAEGLSVGGGKLPNVVTQNIFLTTQDVSVQALKDVPCVKRFVTDDFADFWRSPEIFYENFEEITVYACGKRHIQEQLEELMQVAYGKRTAVKWM